MNFEELVEKVGFGLAFGMMRKRLSKDFLGSLSPIQLVEAYYSLEHDAAAQTAIIELLKDCETDWSTWRQAYRSHSQGYAQRKKWFLEDILDPIIQDKMFQLANADQLIDMSRFVWHDAGATGLPIHEKKYAQAVAQKATTFDHWVFVFEKANYEHPLRSDAFKQIYSLARGFYQKLWVFEQQDYPQEREFRAVLACAKTPDQLKSLYERCPVRTYDHNLKCIEPSSMRRRVLSKLMTIEGKPEDWAWGSLDTELNRVMIKRLRSAAGSFQTWLDIYRVYKSHDGSSTPEIALRKLKQSQASLEEWHSLHTQAIEAKDDQLAKVAYDRMTKVAMNKVQKDT